MNLNLIYFSPTGNTKKIVEMIGKSMSEKAVTYNLTLPKNRPVSLNFTSEDIVLIGVPVYGGRVPKFLLESLNQLQGNQTPAIMVVSYGNRDDEDALMELKQLLHDRGFLIIAAGAFIGEHSAVSELGTNRPDTEDLKMAFNFGRLIKEKLTQNMITDIIVSGHFPYVEKTMPIMGITPETNDTCVDCGLCAKICPMGAISTKDVKRINAPACIRCRACVKRCPVQAKDITAEAYKKMQEILIQNFSSVRKEIQLFI